MSLPRAPLHRGFLEPVSISPKPGSAAGESSVHLHVVATGLLHRLGKVDPDEAVLLGDRREALLHAALHALQSAHVYVGVGLLHEVPELLGVLCVLLLPGDSVVVAELAGVLLSVLLVLVVIEQGL